MFLRVHICGTYGELTQLVECLLCKQEVRSSSLLFSTRYYFMSRKGKTESNVKRNNKNNCK